MTSSELNVSGAYNTTLGDLSLNQSENKVIGIYGRSRLEGTIKGNVLAGEFYYRSQKATGTFSFTFTFSNGILTFDGTWSDYDEKGVKGGRRTGIAK